MVKLGVVDGYGLDRKSCADSQEPGRSESAEEGDTRNLFNGRSGESGEAAGVGRWEGALGAQTGRREHDAAAALDLSAGMYALPSLSETAGVRAVRAADGARASSGLAYLQVFCLFDCMRVDGSVVSGGWETLTRMCAHAVPLPCTTAMVFCGRGLSGLSLAVRTNMPSGSAPPARLRARTHTYGSATHTTGPNRLFSEASYSTFSS